MQHAIQIQAWQEQIGAQIEAMAQAVAACVHCGFCLPVCPTYQALGDETESPRGRIILIKAVLEGSLEVEEALPHIERCLGCLSCAAACPSGVRYGELLLPFRSYAQERVSQPLLKNIQHRLLRETLPHPQRFRAAVHIGKLARPIKGFLPEELKSMLEMLPGRLAVGRTLPPTLPAVGVRRARVALLAGCVQQVLAPEINWATLRVLAANGVEVVIPPDQGCCGAILMHSGEAEQARQLARHNFRVFPQDVDAILTNAAGCGSGMKEYPLLFQGFAEADQAATFARRVQDVSEFLADLGLVEPPPLPQPLRVAYHDACHLAHAQGVCEPPRRLLAAISNLTLVEIPDSGFCCGSAGTYNLTQPETAAELGRHKAEAIGEARCEAVATGNIGCMLQIRTHLQRQGKLVPVFHTLELLDMAYRAVVELA